VVATVDDAGGLCGAVCGALTTPASGLFSHPWKLLSSEQFLRAQPHQQGPRDEQLALVRAIAPGADGRDGLAGALGDRIGEALVPRLFDSSELILRPDLGEGVRRRRFLKEERALADSGLTLTAVPLADNLRRVCQLEAQTASAHGGTPDLGGLVELRTRMLECLGAAIRVPAAAAGGRIVACGIDVTDPDDDYGLVYGCDYSVPERSTAYMCLTFYEPIRYCIARGLGRLRLGFEAFVPKLLRGATVTPRETWVWTPDRQLLEGLSVLLGFLTARADSYFAQLRPRRGLHHPDPRDA
jgi:hypothetical protein